MALVAVLAFVAFLVGWNWWVNGRYWKMLGRAGRLPHQEVTLTHCRLRLVGATTILGVV